MLKSMTGYGHAEVIDKGKKVGVEIKAVNHRYSDLNIKVPRMYAFLEDSIRQNIKSFLKRGKVDIYVSIESFDGEPKKVTMNEDLALNYMSAINDFCEKHTVKNDLAISTLIRLPDVFEIEQIEDDNDELCAIVINALEMAAVSFMEMRIKEGEKLKGDLEERSSIIEKAVYEIEQKAPEIVIEYTKKIRIRMKEILDSTDIDEARLLNEVAIFADRINVSEEIVRLKSHLQQMRDMIEETEPVGRKLDFLIQEMNREINTIGSKTNDLATSKIVVLVKSEIEKLREQIQNVE